MMVSVKAVEGRIARTSPTGSFIPSDRYVSVELTPYLRRLIKLHGDVVVEPAPTKSAPPPVNSKKED